MGAVYAHVRSSVFDAAITSRRFMSSSHSLNYDRSFTAKQARAEGGALGAQAPALFLNYSKVPLSDK